MAHALYEYKEFAREGFEIHAVFDNDPGKTFSFRSDNGVTQHVISVPPDQLYIRFSLFDELTDGDDDLDMYVYYCGTDGASCTKLGESGGPTSERAIDQLFSVPVSPVWSSVI